MHSSTFTLFSPFEVFFSGTDLEMVFHDAEVHQGITHERDATFCNHLVSGGVFKEELLLIDGSGCKQRSIHAIEEPFGSNVTSIADFLDGLYLVADALICAVS